MCKKKCTANATHIGEFQEIFDEYTKKNYVLFNKKPKYIFMLISLLPIQ